MKNAIREYLNYTEKEKAELWDNATFVFDTNVILNLYRYSKRTRDILFKAFCDLGDRIWMPNHVAQEIMKNRCDVISEQFGVYDELSKDKEAFISKCISLLRLSDQEEEIKKLRNFLDNWFVNNQKENQVVKEFDTATDSILTKLLKVFNQKVGEGFSSDEIKRIKEEGNERFAKQVPPGFRDSSKMKGENDNNAYGDLIVWKEILKYAKTNKQDIIYVTNDQKVDWWYITKGKTVGPRIELRKEFEVETSQRFHMYTMNRFISVYNEKNDIGKAAIDEIKELSMKTLFRMRNKQQMKEFFDSLEDETSRKMARINMKLMKLQKKNDIREKSILETKVNHPDWETNEALKQLVQCNEASIARANIQIAQLQAQMHSLMNE